MEDMNSVVRCQRAGRQPRRVRAEGPLAPGAHFLRVPSPSSVPALRRGRRGSFHPWEPPSSLASFTILLYFLSFHSPTPNPFISPTFYVSTARLGSEVCRHHTECALARIPSRPSSVVQSGLTANKHTQERTGFLLVPTAVIAHQWQRQKRPTPRRLYTTAGFPRLTSGTGSRYILCLRISVP